MTLVEEMMDAAMPIQSLDSSNAICIQLVVEYYVLLNLVMKFTPSWGLAGEGHVY